LPWNPEDWESLKLPSEPGPTRPLRPLDTVRQILSKLPAREGKLVADFGGGLGSHPRVVAIEESEACPGQGFDVAVSLEAILGPTVAQIDEALERVWSALAEGGVFLATFPAVSCIGGPFEMPLRAGADSVRTRGFHEVELQYRLQRAGFQGIRIRRFSAGRGQSGTILCMAVRRANN
jgi:hypothetical protein